jgi:hypothetical protein
MPERRTKHFFLLGAVGTPVKPVHLDLFYGQTLGEGVVSGGPPDTGEIVDAGKNDDDNGCNCDRRPGFGLYVFLRFLLISFLYHSLIFLP